MDTSGLGSIPSFPASRTSQYLVLEELIILSGHWVAVQGGDEERRQQSKETVLL